MSVIVYAPHVAPRRSIVAALYVYAMLFVTRGRTLIKRCGSTRMRCCCLPPMSRCSPGAMRSRAPIRCRIDDVIFLSFAVVLCKCAFFSSFAWGRDIDIVRQESLRYILRHITWLLNKAIAEVAIYVYYYVTLLMAIAGHWLLLSYTYYTLRHYAVYGHYYQYYTLLATLHMIRLHVATYTQRRHY